MLKFKRSLITLLIFITLLTIAINIPGDIEKSLNPGEKLPEFPVESSLVSIEFIQTARAKAPELFSIAGGSIFKQFKMVHGAILVKHGNESFLFDTGLGRNIDSQFSKDMPFWIKPFMAYQKMLPAIEQIENSQQLQMPSRIFLSHAHWDHASAIVDFPDLNIWLTNEEYEYLETATPPAVLSSQIQSTEIKWRPYQLKQIPYAGFHKSYDIYDDGTVVLVSLAGHSPGSVGLFVNSKDGIRRFFVGDVVWNVAAVKNLKQKFWIAAAIVDDHKEATNSTIAKLSALLEANPELKIIAAHDLTSWK